MRSIDLDEKEESVGVGVGEGEEIKGWINLTCLHLKSVDIFWLKHPPFLVD